MGIGSKVRPQFEFTTNKEERGISNESVYAQKNQGISQKKNWQTTVLVGSSNKMIKRKYSLNGNANGMSSHDAVDEPTPPDTINAEPEDESSIKRRWRNGNILVMCLPVGASVLPTVFILGVYIHADQYNLMQLKNNTNVPYISDIGDQKPHSSWFTLGLSLGALFAFWLILVRHIQVDKVFHNTGSKANRTASFFGLFGIFGELTVGAFQRTSHFTIHYLSAFGFFVSIMIYMFIQTFIGHRNLPKRGKKKHAVLLVIFRGILSVVLFMSVVIFGTFLLPSLSAYNRKGYSVAQTAEWIMLSCVITFMVTFLYDFKDLTCFVDVGSLKDTKSCSTAAIDKGSYNHSIEMDE